MNETKSAPSAGEYAGVSGDVISIDAIGNPSFVIVMFWNVTLSGLVPSTKHKHSSALSSGGDCLHSPGSGPSKQNAGTSNE
jgi:hypothetical protein